MNVLADPDAVGPDIIWLENDVTSAFGYIGGIKGDVEDIIG